MLDRFAGLTGGVAGAKMGRRLGERQQMELRVSGGINFTRQGAGKRGRLEVHGR